MTERGSGFDVGGLDFDLDLAAGALAEPAAEPTLGPGSCVGPYTIERAVREGAAGTLYAAVDPRGEPARVRVLDPQALGAGLSRERIASDLFTLRGVEHAAVSRVLAIGVEGGRPFYALALRGERTLAEAVRRGRALDELELVWLGRELASGLAALHRAGLAHGGLAAQTVTLSPDHAAIEELDWFARLGGGPGDEGLRPEDDVAALARVLCFAATGGPADAAALRRARPAYRERLHALIEAIEGKVFARPTAARAAHSFAELARDLGLVEGAPRTLRDLLPAQPQPDAGAVSPPPPGGPTPPEPLQARRAGPTRHAPSRVGRRWVAVIAWLLLLSSVSVGAGLVAARYHARVEALLARERAARRADRRHAAARERALRADGQRRVERLLAERAAAERVRWLLSRVEAALVEARLQAARRGARAGEAALLAALERARRAAPAPPAPAPSAPPPEAPPQDPHLVVLEADRLVVERALGGEVRFQATRAFDVLRPRLRRLGDRWRVTVLVRSRPTRTAPPGVECTGVWVKIEDRRSRTVRPMLRFDFDPAPRRVRVAGGGRTVEAFERTPGLDVQRCVHEVERAVADVVTPPVTLIGSR